MDDVESMGMSPLVPSLAMEQIQQSLVSGISGENRTIDPANRSDEEKKRLARDFESVLLTRLFDQMKDSVGNWGLEEDGASQQIQGLFWHFLAQDVSEKGGFGLWQEIYQQFNEMDGSAAAGEFVDGKL